MREIIEELKLEEFTPLLKVLEDYVKNFDKKMLSGQNFPGWKMKPREIWGNWLLCALFKSEVSDRFTFSNDERIDGVIIDKRKGMKAWRLQMEHVLVLADATNANIIGAIERKIGHYSSPDQMGLVVLSNRQSKWQKESIQDFINQKSKFRYVFVINFSAEDENGISYSVAMFGGKKFGKYFIHINPNFTNWTVK